MAMGKRGDDQENLFVTHQQFRSQSHPFYQTVNRILRKNGFDKYVEVCCERFYKKDARAGLAPGV